MADGISIYIIDDSNTLYRKKGCKKSVFSNTTLVDVNLHPLLSFTHF